MGAEAPSITLNVRTLLTREAITCCDWKASQNAGRSRNTFLLKALSVIVMADTERVGLGGVLTSPAQSL